MPGVPCPAAFSPLPCAAREVQPPCAPAARAGAARDRDAAWVAGMNGAGECAQIRTELGVYVLGAIGPGERARVGRHVAWCSRCRDELAGLAGLPGLLRTLAAGEALRAWGDEASQPSPGPPLEGLIRQVARSRGPP